MEPETWVYIVATRFFFPLQIFSPHRLSSPLASCSAYRVMLIHKPNTSLFSPCLPRLPSLPLHVHHDTTFTLALLQLHDSSHPKLGVDALICTTCVCPPTQFLQNELMAVSVDRQIYVRMKIEQIRLDIWTQIHIIFLSVSDSNTNIVRCVDKDTNR